MSKKNTENLIVIIILLLILLTISMNFNRKPTIIENTVKTLATLPSKAVVYPLQAMLNEQKQDQSKIIEENANDTLKKEISELKELLELNKTLTEYTPINSTVLSRNKSYWFNTLTIDKGKNDGIKEDMAVITSKGLIGKISKVYTSSSEVKLITSDDINYKVSIAIKNNDNDIYAILNGYDQKQKLFKVIWVNKTVTIEKNTQVVTSGLGELFPAGIYVGTVEKVETDKYNLSQTLYIKNDQNFNSIHYVTVLKEKK